MAYGVHVNRKHQRVIELVLDEKHLVLNLRVTRVMPFPPRPRDDVAHLALDMFRLHADFRLEKGPYGDIFLVLIVKPS